MQGPWFAFPTVRRESGPCSAELDRKTGFLWYERVGLDQGTPSRSSWTQLPRFGTRENSTVMSWWPEQWPHQGSWSRVLLRMKRPPPRRSGQSIAELFCTCHRSCQDIAPLDWRASTPAAMRQIRPHQLQEQIAEGGIQWVGRLAQGNQRLVQAQRVRRGKALRSRRLWQHQDPGPPRSRKPWGDPPEHRPLDRLRSDQVRQKALREGSWQEGIHFPAKPTHVRSNARLAVTDFQSALGTSRIDSLNSIKQ